MTCATCDREIIPLSNGKGWLHVWSEKDKKNGVYPSCFANASPDLERDGEWIALFR